MKIIDCRAKGNIVRFFLGKDDLKKWNGDDWNDRPYEHNAGEVYEEYVSGFKDISFGFNDILFEPNYGHQNSRYAREDFMKNDIPILVVIPEKYVKDCIFSFEEALAIDGVIKFRMGDKMEPENK